MRSVMMGRPWVVFEEKDRTIRGGAVMKETPKSVVAIVQFVSHAPFSHEFRRVVIPRSKVCGVYDPRLAPNSGGEDPKG